MIQKLEITGVHVKVDKKLHDYAEKKIGKLDHYISRKVRDAAHAEIFLKEVMIKKKKECTCEVILRLPKDTIKVQETTMNMFAAIDIVEAKLKNQLKKYKDLHAGPRIHRRLISRLRRTPSEV